MRKEGGVGGLIFIQYIEQEQGKLGSSGINFVARYLSQWLMFHCLGYSKITQILK
jgi:hypothetical protein